MSRPPPLPRRPRQASPAAAQREGRGEQRVSQRRGGPRWGGRRWRRRWRGRRRSRSGGERVAVSKTPARAVRSPFRLTCLRTAPTGGEEGGEPAGALCRGRRALVVCARSPRAGGRQVTEASGERARGQCVCRDSQIAKSNKKTVTRPRRQQTLQWSASARRAPQVVLRFEKPPAFLSHRLVQLRLDRERFLVTDGSARLLAGSAITVDGRQDDQRCAARRQTTTLAPARRGFLAARQMVSGRRWRHGRDELRGRHVAMRPSY